MVYNNSNLETKEIIQSQGLNYKSNKIVFIIEL